MESGCGRAFHDVSIRTLDGDRAYPSEGAGALRPSVGEAVGHALPHAAGRGKAEPNTLEPVADTHGDRIGQRIGAPACELAAGRVGRRHGCSVCSTDVVAPRRHQQSGVQAKRACPRQDLASLRRIRDWRCIDAVAPNGYAAELAREGVLSRAARRTFARNKHQRKRGTK